VTSTFRRRRPSLTIRSYLQALYRYGASESLVADAAGFKPAHMAAINVSGVYLLIPFTTTFPTLFPALFLNHARHAPDLSQGHVSSLRVMKNLES